MKINTNKLILSVATSLLLGACGSNADKTAESTNQTSVELESANAEKNENVVVDAAFEVPEPYKSYLRQELSETMKNGEYQTVSDEVYNSYISNWFKQAASVEKPNWELITKMKHPEIRDITNAFKRQELIEATKSEIKKDEKSLNTYFAVTGEYLGGLNVDVNTGEYTLIMTPTGRVGRPNESGFYETYFPTESLDPNAPHNPRSVTITIKVPIEKAKEIESLRESIDRNKFEMVRFYGKVISPSVYEDERDLIFRLEAFDVGLRKDGSFKSYFFIGPEEAKKGLQLRYRA